MKCTLILNCVVRNYMILNSPWLLAMCVLNALLVVPLIGTGWEMMGTFSGEKVITTRKCTERRKWNSLLCLGSWFSFPPLCVWTKHGLLGLATVSIFTIWAIFLSWLLKVTKEKSRYIPSNQNKSFLLPQKDPNVPGNCILACKLTPSRIPICPNGLHTSLPELPPNPEQAHLAERTACGLLCLQIDI